MNQVLTEKSSESMAARLSELLQLYPWNTAVKRLKRERKASKRRVNSK